MKAERKGEAREALVDFVMRVSSNTKDKLPEEVKILPEIAKLALPPVGFNEMLSEAGVTCDASHNRNWRNGKIVYICAAVGFVIGLALMLLIVQIWPG